MKDTVLKGTGNSRYLKSVENFKTLYPTYDDFVSALVAGTLPIDLNGINADGMEQIGTAINKANLLTDETAGLIGLDDTATVDQTLSALIQDRIWYGVVDSSPSYNGTYTIEIPGMEVKDGTKIRLWFQSTGFEYSSIEATNFEPKFDINGTGAKRVYKKVFLRADGANYGNSSPRYGDIERGQVVDFMYSGGVWVMVDGWHKTMQGYYVGTGTYGPTGKNTLSFDFLPKFVFIKPSADQATAWVLYPRSRNTGTTVVGISSDSDYAGYALNSSSGAFQWWNTLDAEHQFNSSGKNYEYYAIG